jgi:hypothetical protein
MDAIVMDDPKNPAKPNRALELVPVERAGDLDLFYCNPAAVSSSFVDTDPGRVGSASLFAGFGSGSAFRACRSGSHGSESVSIPSKCIFHFFPENSNMMSKIPKNYDTYATDEKIKLALL